MARRWMAFVDGENLTIRGQEFANAHGVELRPNDAWKRDVFLWLLEDTVASVLRGILITAGIATEPGFIRAHYYTSLRGDDAGITATAEALRTLGFHGSVFKRTSDGRSKGSTSHLRAIFFHMPSSATTTSLC